MSNTPDPKELHKRAGESAKDTRDSITKLSTGALGVFVVLVIQDIEPSLTIYQVAALWASIVLTVLSLSCAVFGAYADAQWAYHWAKNINTEIFQGRSPSKEVVEQSMQSKNHESATGTWHSIKAWMETLMLVFFVMAAIAMGVFLYFRTLALIA